MMSVDGCVCVSWPPVSSGPCPALLHYVYHEDGVLFRFRLVRQGRVECLMGLGWVGLFCKKSVVLFCCCWRTGFFGGNAHQNNRLWSETCALDWILPLLLRSPQRTWPTPLKQQKRHDIIDFRPRSQQFENIYECFESYNTSCTVPCVSCLCFDANLDNTSSTRPTLHHLFWIQPRRVNAHICYEYCTVQPS